MTPQRKIDRVMRLMLSSPSSVSFRDLEAVCDHYFGSPRLSPGSHRIYGTPWRGDPRVNIQNDHGTSEAYQVRQVLAAIERLTANNDHDHQESDNA